MWDTNNDYSYCFPNGVTLNADEKEVYSDLYPEIKSYVEEMTVKFIMGLESFDNYDNFLATLNSLGAQDLVAVYQSAYDRYANETQPVTFCPTGRPGIPVRPVSIQTGTLLPEYMLPRLYRRRERHEVETARGQLSF